MEMQQNTSKYVKPARENKVFYLVSIAFLFSLVVMPQYFGVPFPMFDFTLLRIMIIILMVMIISDSDRKRQFVMLFTNYKYSLVVIPYIIVLGYTMVLRADINALLNPLLELLGFYLTVYIVKYVLGVEKTINLLVKFTYLLVILGVIEYALGRSPFSYLETIDGLYTGQFIRSGHYRIMGPCNHSLGYGLMLVCIAPVGFIDLAKKQVNVVKRPLLLVLIAANALLTGSRSTLIVFILEVILIFVFSDTSAKKKFILIGGAVVAFIAMYVLAFNSSSIAQYIMLQLTTIIDEIFGTNLSVQYGASEQALGSSSNYRDQLIYIFSLDWLNPFLGLGRKRAFASEINGTFVHSVDNFYIAEYIRYAYPGLVAYILYIGYYLLGMTKGIRKKENRAVTGLLIGTVCYLINLYWVDSLQTLKYLYILFAIFIVMSGDEIKNKTIELNRNKIKSKYIKE